MRHLCGTQRSKIRGFPPREWGPRSAEGRMATVKHALNGKSPATDAAAEKTASGEGKGLTFERYFTDGKKSPFDAVEWEKLTVLIGNEKGVTIFRQEDVEVPKSWSWFINSVNDDMESIMKLTRTEGMLFKWGSGTGTNFSTLRGSKETLSGGGIASGPVSFMKGFDAFAGVIKSGGKTRRAAKMVILNIDHPDIVEFIECKMKEERKAPVLIEQGYDRSIDGDAYASIFFQSANHPWRVTARFMPP